MSGQPESAKRIDNWNVEVGRRIRARRLERGLSQTELGAKLGVTFQQIQKYEKGSNSVSSGRLGQISDILEVPITFFYGSDGPAQTGEARLAESSLFGLLQSHDTLRMAKAFNQLPSRDLRSALVGLIEKIAAADTVRRKKAPRKKRSRAGADK
jgi:transcriptional regulator with XRE-family HTH domain